MAKNKKDRNQAAEEALVEEDVKPGRQAPEAADTKDEGEAETPEAPAAPEGAEAPERDYEAELAAEKDRYLRLAAEFDNYRKRAQREREALYGEIRAETIAELLPIYDNLERALAAECADGAFYKGVQMTMNQLVAIFQKMGVEPIETLNAAFDPSLHNAVIHVEDEGLGQNVIVEEYQKGFKYKDRIIRFAMVKVAN